MTDASTLVAPNPVTTPETDFLQSLTVTVHGDLSASGDEHLVYTALSERGFTAADMEDVYGPNWEQVRTFVSGLTRMGTGTVNLINQMFGEPNSEAARLSDMLGEARDMMETQSGLVTLNATLGAVDNAVLCNPHVGHKFGPSFLVAQCAAVGIVVDGLDGKAQQFLCGPAQAVGLLD